MIGHLDYLGAVRAWIFAEKRRVAVGVGVYLLVDDLFFFECFLCFDPVDVVLDDCPFYDPERGYHQTDVFQNAASLACLDLVDHHHDFDDLFVR
jgi:hypothetical protein